MTIQNRSPRSISARSITTATAVVARPLGTSLTPAEIRQIVLDILG
jgi:hypothetical protein